MRLSLLMMALFILFLFSSCQIETDHSMLLPTSEESSISPSPLISSLPKDSITHSTNPVVTSVVKNTPTPTSDESSNSDQAPGNTAGNNDNLVNNSFPKFSPDEAYKIFKDRYNIDSSLQWTFVYDSDQIVDGKAYYMFHLFNFVPKEEGGSVTTIGWYYIDNETGEAFQMDLDKDILVPLTPNLNKLTSDEISNLLDEDEEVFYQKMGESQDWIYPEFYSGFYEYYSEIGIGVSINEGVVTNIFLDERYEIDGIRTGMSFNEIKGILGEGNLDVRELGTGKKIYVLYYPPLKSLKSHCVYFVSENEEGLKANFIIE